MIGNVVLCRSQKTPSSPEKGNGPNFLLVKGSESLTWLSAQRSSLFLGKWGHSVSRGKAWIGSGFFFFFGLASFVKFHF